MSVPLKYKCFICNKYYKSKQSYWNHKNKFHKDDNHKIIEYNHPNDTTIMKCNPILDT